MILLYFFLEPLDLQIKIFQKKNKKVIIIARNNKKN